MNVCGVDLGTINCSVSTVYKNEKNEIVLKTLKNKADNYSFRSTIQFKELNDVIVGKDYFEMDKNMIDSTVELIKTRLGEVDNIEVVINKETFHVTPQFLVAIILKYIKNSYTNLIDRAVITVPAYSSQNKRNAIIEAANIANFEVIELIEEPSAAVMYHLYEKYKDSLKDILYLKKKKNILVFDFGGGTLDLSLVSVSLDDQNNIVPKVEMTSGDNNLGGKLIDLEFADFIIDYLYKSYGDDFIVQVKEHFKYYFDNFKCKSNFFFRRDVQSKVKGFIFNLLKKLEEAKIKLSKEEEVSISIGNGYEDISVTREIFEQAIIVNKNIENYILDVLKRFNSKNIDEVILVGGSSQIPYIKTILEKGYMHEHSVVFSNPNYNYAISNGAAIVAAIKSNMNIEPFGYNNCSGVIAKDIFVRYENSEQKFISCGEKYPFDMSKIYNIKINFALTPNINIKFVEKSIEEGKELSNVINDINFYHPCFYTGETIQISLQVDEIGLFKFRAIHKETGEEIEFESKKEYSLSEFEILKQNEKLKDIRLGK